ncbi:MAG: hypothetical protein U5M51_14690 [Emticicia sp.]|nr:hypothetical protein [Emticicia sp.]
MKTDIQLLYGGAKIPYHEMNDFQKEEVSKQILERAKEKAFSRGLPIYYNDNNTLIAEFADGRKFVVENQQFVRPYDGK